MSGLTLTQQELLALGLAAAKAIKSNLPVDGFGETRRLNDYADLWGAAARTAVLTELGRVLDARPETDAADAHDRLVAALRELADEWYGHTGCVDDLRALLAEHEARP